MTKDGLVTAKDLFEVVDGLKEITRSQGLKSLWGREKAIECPACKEIELRMINADEDMDNIHEEWGCGNCGHIENYWWKK